MQTKLSQVLAAMDSGDWRKAFSIASKFGDLGTQKEAITRAQSAINNPSFYRQIGRDPDEAIKAGGAAMRERFEAMRNRRNPT
jgi:hypothetical protein